VIVTYVLHQALRAIERHDATGAPSMRDIVLETLRALEDLDRRVSKIETTTAEKPAEPLDEDAC